MSNATLTDTELDALLVPLSAFAAPRAPKGTTHEVDAALRSASLEWQAREERAAEIRAALRARRNA